MRFLLLSALLVTSLAGAKNEALNCFTGFDDLLETGHTLEVHGFGDWGVRVDSLVGSIERFAQDKGLKALAELPDADFERNNVVGMRVYALATTAPDGGKPGTASVISGRIECVGNHLVNGVIRPRDPIHDVLVIVDEKGERHLVDNSDERDRVFVDPADRKAMKTTAELTVRQMLRLKGWEKITPHSKVLANHAEALVGKEFVGYSDHIAGDATVVDPTQRASVRGIILRTVRDGYLDKELSGLKKDGKSYSPVTGAPPYISVQILTPHGSVLTISLSAPGEYHVRDLNP